MLLGPIFQVEMVSPARRKRYFVLRVLYAVLILLVMWTSSSLKWRMVASIFFMPENLACVQTVAGWTARSM